MMVMTGCAAEAEPETEEMGETTSSIDSSTADVDGWLASQGTRGDELEAILDDQARPTFGGSIIRSIGKMIGGVIVKRTLGGFSKAVIGAIRLRVDRDVFVDLEFESREGTSTAKIENALRILQIQAALRDGAELEPVADKSSAKLVARFGGKASQYRVYEGGDYKGTDGTTIATRVFMRTGGKAPKVVAVRTITREGASSDSPRVTDLPKGVF